MADPTPQPSRSTSQADRLMLNSMSDLTRALERLNAHMESADQAAQQRARDVANADSLSARSRPSYGTSPLTAARAAPTDAKTAQDRLAELKAQRDAQPQQTNVGESVPPDSRGSGGGRQEEDPNAPSDAEALTFAMLGQHGGPFGRLRMQQYMLQRNIAWGASTTDAALGWLNNQTVSIGNPIKGAMVEGGSAALDHVNRALEWAQTPKGQWAALGGLAAYRTSQHAINAITNWQDAGRALGYGNQGNYAALGSRTLGLLLHPGRAFDAAREGLSMSIEEQALMGRIPGSGLGTGLSSDQAKAAVGTLAAQGFSNQGGVTSLNPFHNMVSGDNMNIAQNFLRPLMNMGLTAQDAAQWTPALRNASTSMQQLRDELSNLPTAAKTAKQTVGEMNAQLEQLGQTLVSQGGTLQKGPELGMAWEAGTGMQPAIANQLTSNPIYQGMMMGQYGVLPSGIADLPGGAQAQGMLSMFNLLRSATAGLNHDKYMNVPGAGRVKVANGWALQDSQIAQMMGISRAEVDRLRNQSQHAGAIEQTLTALGSNAGQDKTGLFDPNMSDAQRQKIWTTMVDHRRSALGLSSAQLKKIDSKGNFTDRYKELQKDLLGNQSNQQGNQINVHLKFTGPAAKWFEQAGKATGSGLALQANAGGNALNNTLNSPLGEALAANSGLPIPGTFSVH